MLSAVGGTDSDFVSETTKGPAALWHVVFDEVCEKHCRYSPAAMGEEDLEEHEGCLSLSLTLLTCHQTSRC